tara:strand:- start:30 stop:224 length:195 start_codon:yes stop_codon:yes gene_type:complete
MSLFDIQKKSNVSAYIEMGNVTIYLDNSTGEQIIKIWKTAGNTGQISDIHKSYFDIEKQKRVKL